MAHRTEDGPDLEARADRLVEIATELLLVARDLRVAGTASTTKHSAPAKHSEGKTKRGLDPNLDVGEDLDTETREDIIKID